MGLLVQEDAKRLRAYFDEMAKLIGQHVLHKAPKPDKHYTDYTEIESNYGDWVETDVIFDEYPTQQTLKKIGWYSEGTETQPILHASWNLQHLQQGSLFLIPSGIDGAEGRLFRVTKMTNIMQFPDRCYCYLVPEYKTTNRKSQQDYSNGGMNYLRSDEDED